MFEKGSTAETIWAVTTGLLLSVPLALGGRAAANGPAKPFVRIERCLFG